VRRSTVFPFIAACAAVLIGLPQSGALAGGDAARPSAAGGGTGGVVAPSVQVQTLNFVFIPDPVQIQVGQTIKWVNPIARSNHTATDLSALALFDSGDIVEGGSWSFAFTAGGSYPYECTIHERFDMISSVSVMDQVSPPSGPVGTVFTVKVASIPAPTDYVYDVQKKNPGGIWRGWMLGVTTATVSFDSTGFPTGTYRFRSRLHRISDDAASSYSPAVSVSVT
jgi:plastocyanin